MGVVAISTRGACSFYTQSLRLPKSWVSVMSDGGTRQISLGNLSKPATEHEAAAPFSTFGKPAECCLGRSW